MSILKAIPLWVWIIVVVVVSGTVFGRAMLDRISDLRNPAGVILAQQSFDTPVPNSQEVGFAHVSNPVLRRGHLAAARLDEILTDLGEKEAVASILAGAAAAQAQGNESLVEGMVQRLEERARIAEVDCTILPTLDESGKVRRFPLSDGRLRIPTTCLTPEGERLPIGNTAMMATVDAGTAERIFSSPEAVLGVKPRGRIAVDWTFS